MSWDASGDRRVSPRDARSLAMSVVVPQVWMAVNESAADISFGRKSPTTGWKQSGGRISASASSMYITMSLVSDSALP